MPSRVQWYADRVHHFTTVGPAKAFALSAAQAAGYSAKAVKSKGTGALARDVSRPRPAGPMRAFIASNLIYAGIQNDGGTIYPRKANRLLIRGKRGGGRSSVGGDIVASADSVTITGKHYLEEGASAFPRLMLNNLKRML